MPGPALALVTPSAKILVDILNPRPYLIAHCCSRVLEKPVEETPVELRAKGRRSDVVKSPRDKCFTRASQPRTQFLHKVAPLSTLVL